MNLTDYLSHVGNRVNGKALRKPDLNLVAKLDAMGVELRGTNTNVVTNPITGFSAPLDPFVAALVRWCYEVYSTYDFSGAMNYNGTNGRHRHLRPGQVSDFGPCDNKAYSNFLD